MAQGKGSDPLRPPAPRQQPRLAGMCSSACTARPASNLPTPLAQILMRYLDWPCLVIIVAAVIAIAIPNNGDRGYTSFVL